MRKELWEIFSRERDRTIVPGLQGLHRGKFGGHDPGSGETGQAAMDLAIIDARW